MPWSPPTPAEHLARLRREAPAFGEVGPGDLDRAVPSCPGWTVRDLVRHVGMVHEWCAENVRLLAPMREATNPDVPDDDPGLLAWVGRQADDLVEVLGATDPDALMWTHVGGGAAAYWFRRMAHETGVHRLDLHDALGRGTDPVAPADAADGVDEFLHVYATRRDRHGHLRGAGERLVLAAQDADAAWLVACSPADGEVTRLASAGDGPADAPRLTGDATTLLRVVWGRGDAREASLQGEQAEAAIVLGRLRATAI